MNDFREKLADPKPYVEGVSFGPEGARAKKQHWFKDCAFAKDRKAPLYLGIKSMTPACPECLSRDSRVDSAFVRLHIGLSMVIECQKYVSVGEYRWAYWLMGCYYAARMSEEFGEVEAIKVAKESMDSYWLMHQDVMKDTTGKWICVKNKQEFSFWKCEPGWRKSDEYFLADKEQWAYVNLLNGGEVAVMELEEGEAQKVLEVFVTLDGALDFEARMELAKAVS